jgi:heat shock protein HtpX
MNIFAFAFGDKIALMTVRAVRVSPNDDPELYQTVERLAHKAGLPMPRVYISPAAAPNAFATGCGPHHSSVCVTAGLRKLLTKDELTGVIAHELSHIKNRDTLISTIAAIIAGAISWVGYLALSSAGGSDRKGNPLVALALFILAPLAATLIQLAISRSREYEADRIGAAISGSRLGLASALKKLDSSSRRIALDVPDSQSNMFIVQPLTGSTFSRLFSTHPPIEKRIERLTMMQGPVR